MSQNHGWVSAVETDREIDETVERVTRAVADLQAEGAVGPARSTPRDDPSRADPSPPRVRWWPWGGKRPSPGDSPSAGRCSVSDCRAARSVVEQAPAPSGRAGGRSSGKAVDERHRATCHGASGGSGTVPARPALPIKPPPLTEGRLPDLASGSWATVVRDGAAAVGLAPQMPAFGRDPERSGIPGRRRLRADAGPSPVPAGSGTGRSRGSAGTGPADRVQSRHPRRVRRDRLPVLPRRRPPQRLRGAALRRAVHGLPQDRRRPGQPRGAEDPRALEPESGDPVGAHPQAGRLRLLPAQAPRAGGARLPDLPRPRRDHAARGPGGAAHDGVVRRAPRRGGEALLDCGSATTDVAPRRASN